MSEAELQAYLEDNGYPDHVVAAGSAGLVRRWNQFVEEVERGYRYRLEDYRYDLDLRGVIDTAGLAEAVRDADERLDNMLVERDIRVWESAARNPFWDFGYPCNAGGDLRRDLERQGLWSGA